MVVAFFFRTCHESNMTQNFLRANLGNGSSTQRSSDVSGTTTRGATEGDHRKFQLRKTAMSQDR